MSQNNIDARHLDKEIDIRDLILMFWKKKITIIGITSLFAIVSVFYALSLSNIYTATALLAPTDQQESLNSKLASYKNLAGLAGVKIPGSGSASRTQEAIERIKSYKFFTENFLPKIKLENLMALQKWSQENDKLYYNNNAFDSNLNKWIREVEYPQTVEPSKQESYKRYQDILSITVDDDTGFVYLAIDHMSPKIAKKWLDIIIFQINANMRELDKQKAESSIRFLNESSSSTSVQSIKEAIAALLEEQMQTLMLASSNQDYIFKIIEAPIAPEIKSKPSRAIICIIFTIIGGFFSLIYVVVQHNFKNIINFLKN